MTTTPNDPQANPEETPATNTEAPVDTTACMGKFKHKWNWKWVNGIMTNTVVCSTCGTEKEQTRFQGQ
jgi:hypothetical protein